MAEISVVGMGSVGRDKKGSERSIHIEEEHAFRGGGCMQRSLCK